MGAQVVRGTKCGVYRIDTQTKGKKNMVYKVAPSLSDISIAMRGVG